LSNKDGLNSLLFLDYLKSFLGEAMEVS